jgi:hypothetical protein
MRVAWAGSCSRSSVAFRPCSSVSASKTTRCSGSCQRWAWSFARIAARVDEWCVPRGSNGGGSVHTARRILDSRSSTSCGLGLVDIVAQCEGRRSDCSQVARQIQRGTLEGSDFRVKATEKADPCPRQADLSAAKGACGMTRCSFSASWRGVRGTGGRDRGRC